MKTSITTELKATAITSICKSLCKATSDSTLSTLICNITKQALVNGRINSVVLIDIINAENASKLKLTLGNTKTTLGATLVKLLPISWDKETTTWLYNKEKATKKLETLGLTFQTSTLDEVASSIYSLYTKDIDNTPKSFKATNYDKKVEKAQDLTTLDLQAELKATQVYMDNLKRIQKSKLAELALAS